jgi:hypothetical protein
MLVMRSSEGMFLRWFAQADGFAKLLQNANCEADDVVIFNSGSVRVGVSCTKLPPVPSCAGRTIRQAGRSREMALAAKPGGRA